LRTRVEHRVGAGDRCALLQEGDVAAVVHRRVEYVKRQRDACDLPVVGIPQKPAEFTLVVLFAASGPAMAMAAGFPRVSMSRHTWDGAIHGGTIGCRLRGTVPGRLQWLDERS